MFAYKLNSFGVDLLFLKICYGELLSRACLS
jgi:hypothetical protein